jgi:hypothetical protein
MCVSFLTASIQSTPRIYPATQEAEETVDREPAPPLTEAEIALREIRELVVRPSRCILHV